VIDHLNDYLDGKLSTTSGDVPNARAHAARSASAALSCRTSSTACIRTSRQRRRSNGCSTTSTTPTRPFASRVAGVQVISPRVHGRSGERRARPERARVLGPDPAAEGRHARGRGAAARAYHRARVRARWLRLGEVPLARASRSRGNAKHPVEGSETPQARLRQQLALRTAVRARTTPSHPVQRTPSTTRRSSGSSSKATPSTSTPVGS
jgi:hypothetical protein